MEKPPVENPKTKNRRKPKVPKDTEEVEVSTRQKRPPKQKIPRKTKAELAESAKLECTFRLPVCLRTLDILKILISYLDYRGFCAFRLLSPSIYQRTKEIGYTLRDRYLTKQKLNPIAIAQIYQNRGYLAHVEITRRKMSKEAREQLMVVLPYVAETQVVRSIYLRLLASEKKETPKEKFPDAPYVQTKKAAVKPKSSPVNHYLVARVINEDCQSSFTDVPLSFVLPYASLENEYLLQRLMAETPFSFLNNVVERDNADLYDWILTHLDAGTVEKIKSRYHECAYYANNIHNIVDNDRVNIFTYLYNHGPNILLFKDPDSFNQNWLIKFALRKDMYLASHSRILDFLHQIKDVEVICRDER